MLILLLFGLILRGLSLILRRFSLILLRFYLTRLLLRRLLNRINVVFLGITLICIGDNYRLGRYGINFFGRQTGFCSLQTIFLVRLFHDFRIDRIDLVFITLTAGRIILIQRQICIELKRRKRLVVEPLIVYEAENTRYQR